VSTPPEPADLTAKLNALLTLSQEFETCEIIELAEFQQFVASREILLAEIFELRQAVSLSEEASAMVSAIEEVDERLNYRLEREQDEQAKNLRDMTQVKSVLGAYKFPSINTSSGVENQG
jgi:hypothetical protein